MKSRPILFSAPMVRALRDGSKTQTRRVVKGQQAWPANTHHVAMLESRGTAMAVDARRCSHAPEIKCPYGQPGDQLWVKESHEFTYLDGRTHCIYKADGLELPVDHPFGEAPACYKTRPSMFMHRWASRITLEITGVFVEQLQDINQEDAQAEGVYRHSDGNYSNYMSPSGFALDARSSYASLWESINGPGSWAANPWVWVVEFKKLEVTQ